MLTENTLDILRHLKLQGMAQALEEQRDTPNTHALAFEERLALLWTGSVWAATTHANADYCAKLA